MYCKLFNITSVLYKTLSIHTISCKCSDTMLIQPRWKVFDCQLQCVCDVEREINLVRIFFVSPSWDFDTCGDRSLTWINRCYIMSLSINLSTKYTLQLSNSQFCKNKTNQQILQKHNQEFHNRNVYINSS